MTFPAAPDDMTNPVEMRALTELRRENATLRERLREAEETLDAIRTGDVDAVVIGSADGTPQIYTLETADRSYRALVEEMQEGALTLTGDGTILYCNRRLAEMVGLAAEHVVGGAVQRFIAEDNAGAFGRFLATKSAKAEFVMLTTSGQSILANFSLSRLGIGLAGLAECTLCCVVTDLTEQRRQGEALQAAHDRLLAEMDERERTEALLRQSQKLEAVGQLTGGVAHDFNNLLTIIRSSVDFLRRRDLPEERRRRYIDAISDTVDRAAKLTGQLLAFARRQPLAPEVFDAGSRVEQIVDMMRTVVGSRIEIVLERPVEPCFVEADAAQFETALVNLAVNARDAMDGEGRLVIEIRSATHVPAIRAHLPGSGRFVTVSIADSGCGIPPDALHKVFEPFYTTKDIGKGTGLGLSQVIGFAKQSHGDVDVQSEVGRGSVFTLYLPHTTGRPRHEKAKAILSEKSGNGDGTSVLVVEDNADVGAFSTQMLEDLGYRTTWVSNADEALKLLARDELRFDIVFSDVVMPGMSGVDLGETIRRLYPGLPVVLTSGYSHVLAEEGRHGFQLLQKPYSVETMSRVLRRSIGAGSPRQRQALAR